MKKITLSLVILSSIFIFVTNLHAYTYSNELEAVIKAVLQEDYSQALDECYRLEKKASSKLKGEIFYTRGICLMGVGKHEQARDVFKKALNYASQELSSEVYISIGDTYFQEAAYEKAISIYEQILNKSANDDNKAMLYFKLGKSHQKKSEWAKTKYYFDLLEKKFPNSFELELVKKSSIGGNFFTIQVGCFSNQINAKKLQSDLNTKGYDVFIAPFKTNGKQLYRVRVGEFMSRVAAEHTERELRTQEHLPTHIFP